MLVLCDFARLETVDAIYDHLQAELAFPDYFGRNLDALHDCLTDISSPTRLILTGTGAPCAKAFLPVFRDAARENKYLSVEMHKE